MSISSIIFFNGGHIVTHWWWLLHFNFYKIFYHTTSSHFRENHNDLAQIIFTNCLLLVPVTFCLTSPSWFQSILFTNFARQRVIEPERQNFILVILTAISSPYLYRDCGKHLIFLLSESRSRARVRASGKAAKNEGRSPSIILLFHSPRVALKKERRPLAITQSV